MREVFVDIPRISWDEIGGLDKAKHELIKAIEWPIKHNEIFSELQTKPPKGILLYGPPGTGKTLLAKASASGTSANFISVKGPEFLSKWVGETEKAIRTTFRKAKQAAPCIIFFDEIESIVPIRGHSSATALTERIVSQLLTEMDGLEEVNGIIVIAATNRPDIIDPALLRPGRFDKKIEIGLPDKISRLEILKVHLNGKLIDEAVRLDDLANLLDGRSGAEIQSLVKDAIMTAIERYVSLKESNEKINPKGWIITSNDFNTAFVKMQENEILEKKYQDPSFGKMDSSYT